MLQYYNPSLCLLVGAFGFYLTSSVVKVVAAHVFHTNV